MLDTGQNFHRLIASSMGCKSDPRVSTVEDDELRFEHDIPQDLQRVPVIGLDGPLAQVVRRRQRRKVDKRASNRAHVAVAQPDVEVGELGVAREVVAFRGAVPDVTWDCGIVGLYSKVVEEQERSSSVGDCGVSLRVGLGLAIPNRKAVGCELPEPLGFVDGCELHGAGELRTVDFAELVRTHGRVFEVCSEDWLLECGHHVFEESWLRLSLSVHCDGVDVGESEAEESVGIGVLDKTISD